MPEQRLQLRRGGVELPSRLLDDIYWLGRYVERADNTARLLRAGIERLSYDTANEPTPGLEAIIDALVFLEVLPKANAADRRPTTEATLRSVLKGASTGNELRSTLHRVHELTLRARTRLSRDAWHVLHRLKWSLDEIDNDEALMGPDRVIDLLDTLLIRLAAVSGTVLDTMVRGHSWLFLDMGRKLERSVFVLGLLQNFLPKGATRVHYEALLEVSDSLLTYRARYLSSLQAAPVVDLLLTDETNPHSLRYQVDAIVSHFAGLPQEPDAQRSQAERRMIRLQAELMTFDVMSAYAGDAAPLHQVLHDWVTSLFQFSDELAQRFFSHVETSHALAPATWLSDEIESR
jgi:uncharacterized alpha-E superfamily protein